MVAKLASSVAAFSVTDFCSAHGICRSTLYALWRQGRGPTFFRIGKRRLISIEAAAEWRARMERNTAEQREAAA